jgi:RNA polymerase sigma-70 factor, ECF subfamily
MRSNASGDRSHDRTAEFLRLLGEHERSLYVFVLATVTHWADADDIVQETKIRLWEQFDKYQPGTDFGAWARSVAHYLILAYHEKAKRERLRFSQAFCEAVAAEAQAAPHLVSDRQQALLHCLEKLGKARRRLIELYYAGKESLRELAQRLGQSYDATRKTVYRTQIALSQCIESQLRKDAEL